MVVQTRSKSKILKENLTEAEYSAMFKSLNLHLRRNRKRAASERAEEIVNAMCEESASESESNYEPAQEEVRDVKRRRSVSIEQSAPVIAAPVNIEHRNNEEPTRTRNKMSTSANVLQLVFYCIGIIAFACIIYFCLTGGEEKFETVLVRRHRI